MELPDQATLNPRHHGIVRGACLASLATAGLFAPTAHGQLIFNEGSAASAERYLDDTDSGKPYEGFDYGNLPHSGSPANAFPDVDGATPGDQTTLPNGWYGTTGWGHTQGNGGDWFELVVTEDNADLRGYTVYWENRDSGDGGIGTDPDGRGFVKFSNDARWSNLRGGTIITLSEDDSFAEVTPSGPTAHLYNLSTDDSFDPIGIGTPDAPAADGDWHMHFHVDEDGPGALFGTGSEVKVDNDDWRVYIFDATNTDPVNDKTTGLVQSAVGESAPGWGGNTGAGGVNGQEVINLTADPESGLTAADYEDVDWSTFGRPNLYNDPANGGEATLGGVQDFSSQRGWLANTLVGDTNFDGDVDGDDVFAVVNNFTGNGGSTTKPWSRGSFDGDGDVDGDDYFDVVQNFTGAVTGPTAMSFELNNDPSNPDLIYDSQTGNVTLFAEVFFDTYQIRTLDEADFDELAAQFAWAPAGGLTDLTNNEMFQLDAIAAFVAQTVNGETLFDLGDILPAGLTETQLANIFDEARWANGTSAVGDFDLIVANVPEPSVLALLGISGTFAILRRRRRIAA